MADRGPDITLFILSSIFWTALYGIVALHNDLADAEVDRLNRRTDIPYGMGRITRTHLLRTIAILSTLLTTIGVVINYHVLLWAGLYLLLGYAYSGPANIKGRGIYAALLLGICYGAMPWLISGVIIDQPLTSTLLVMALTSTVFCSGIIVLKDFKDIDGDRAMQKNTLLVQKGAHFVRRYYIFTTTLAYLCLMIYTHVTASQPLLLLTIILLASINIRLLAPHSLLYSPSARGREGSMARALFFAMAATAYLVMM